MDYCALPCNERQRLRFSLQKNSGGARKVPKDALLGSLLGACGQFAYDVITAPRAVSADKTPWFSSDWSPIKKMTDHEYASILEEKILRMEVEIALVDDNIAALKAQKQEQAKPATKSS